MKNFIATIAKSSSLRNTKILVICPKEHLEEFASLQLRNGDRIIERTALYKPLNKVLGKFASFLKRDIQLDLLFLRLKYPNSQFYPVNGYPIIGLGKRQIFWIPDLQHKMLPENFTKHQCDRLETIYSTMGNYPYPLIMSSRDSIQTYRNCYPNSKCKTICIPFASEISKYIESQNLADEIKILEKFKLAEGEKIKKYFYIANQFWKHKNHAVAFSGFFEYCSESSNNDYLLVCSGATSDVRSPEYYPRLLQQIDDSPFRSRILILGQISRREQITILKNCSTLIQPSNFEGWGTSVQEAKLFGKNIVLSDIPVHHEQGEISGLYFNPRCPKELGSLMSKIQHAPCRSFDREETIAEFNRQCSLYSTEAGRVFDLIP